MVSTFFTLTWVLLNFLQIYFLYILTGFPWWFSGEEPACQCRRPGFNPWIGKIPWKIKWQPTSVSCLENPMDRGACWTTVYGVTKGQT